MRQFFSGFKQRAANAQIAVLMAIGLMDYNASQLSSICERVNRTAANDDTIQLGDNEVIDLLFK